MILTVTPAPAIDWTVAVDTFDFDAVNRMTASEREPSGKGINVSWALHRAGVPTTAIFPGGGNTGQFMSDALRAAAMPFEQINTGHDIRTNITLVTPGHSTKINEVSHPISADHLDQLTAAVLSHAENADTVLICGSLPPGVTSDYPRAILELLSARGVRTVIDTSGPALEQALPGQPSLIKPNVHELAELVGARLDTLGDVVAAAREAIARGAGAVLASLGADGALYVDAERALAARANDIPFINSVGAGDALLAGFVASSGPADDALRNAVLWASSAVAHATTLFPIRTEFLQRIAVRDVDDIDTPLSEPSIPLLPLSTTK